MNKKVVLAYSGGLDTSFCVVYLSKVLSLDVHAVSINTGGFSQEDILELEKKALKSGAKTFTLIDQTKNFYHDCVRFLIYGNVLKNNTYPLSVSAERVCQAMAIAEYAKGIKADFVAHGSTGAGNDQVRFDVVFNVLIPEIKIITPIRELTLSREQEIKFLQEHGVDMNFQKAEYSINKGLWGTSIGGKETLTSDKPLPQSAYLSQLQRNDEQDLTLTFEKGELIKIDEKFFSSKVEAIIELNKIASEFAIGRDIHIGDTIIGIKGRVAFEAPAALLIIKAHHHLEKYILSKHQQIMKEQLASWYGNWLHEGQFLDPVMRNIEDFFLASQQKVSGEVYLTLKPYHFCINGINSPYNLMKSAFGVYGEENKKWSGDDVKGFAKVLSNAQAIYHSLD